MSGRQPARRARLRRVLLVTRPGVGGAAHHVEQIARHLDRDRFRLTILASPLEDPSYPGRLRQAGVEVLEVPLPRAPRPLADLRAALQLGHALLWRRPDVVHAHTAKPGALVRVLGWLCGVPRILYTPHGYYFTYDLPSGQRSFYLALERLLGRWCHAVVALTRAEEEIAQRLSPGRSALVPNAVPALPRATPAERAQVRREFGWPEDCLLATLVGRVEAPKEPQVAVDAVATLANAGLPVHLLVVGTGREMAGLEEHVRRVAPPGRVHLAGPRQDGARLQAAADVALLASRSEGLPYVLLEAGAAAVPVVATDLPGCREVVTSGVNGFLAPAGEVVPFADHLRCLLEDAALRRRMGEAGRQRVQEHHDLRTWITRLEDLYLGRSC